MSTRCLACASEVELRQEAPNYAGQDPGKCAEVGALIMFFTVLVSLDAGELRAEDAIRELCSRHLSMFIAAKEECK